MQLSVMEIQRFVFETRCSDVFILTVPGGSSFVDQFCYLCFMSAMPCCTVCFLQPCGHPLGKG